jgi:23S rRNA pseudouridine1911/1915/1917 synthase
VSARRQGKRGKGKRKPAAAVLRIEVARGEGGRTLAALLAARLGLPRHEIESILSGRRVRVGGAVCPDAGRRLQRGDRLEVELTPKPAKPARPREAAPAWEGPAPVVRYQDEHLVVVDKPAGLTTMRHAHEAAEFGARARRYLPPTLEDLLPPLLTGKGRVTAVHRIDKETSGLVAFARTPEAARHLGQQFREHSVERAYLALVRGHPPEGRVESYLVRDRGDGRRGSTDRPDEGQLAVTTVRVLERLGNYALVECRLETGRTHQVRIDLGERGAPLCGERVYDRPRGGAPTPDGSGAVRPCLHAAVLGLTHPATGAALRWESPLPPDMAALLKRFGAGAKPPGPRTGGSGR